MYLSYIFNYLGENCDKYFGVVFFLIIQLSNFVYECFDDFCQVFVFEFDVYFYICGNNFIVKILWEKFVVLEGMEEVFVCVSGSGVIVVVVMSQVLQGDYVVCVNVLYFWIKILFIIYLLCFGVSIIFVDGILIEEIVVVIQGNMCVLYLESFNLFIFECQDLVVCVEFVKKYGFIFIIDNSYVFFIFQQLYKLGIDLVVYLGIKYLNGYSDVVVGCICGSRVKIEQIFQQEYMIFGLIISLLDVVLVICGLCMLEFCMQKSDSNGMIIVQCLEDYFKVK